MRVQLRFLSWPDVLCGCISESWWFLRSNNSTSICQSKHERVWKQWMLIVIHLYTSCGLKLYFVLCFELVQIWNGKHSEEGSSQVVKQSIFLICCSITWLSQGMFRVISSCHFSDQDTHTIIQNTSTYSYHHTIFIVWYIYLHEWLIVYKICLDDGYFWSTIPVPWMLWEVVL